MSISEFVPVAAAVVAIVGAVAAFWQNRKKVVLDGAQAEAVAIQVRKTNNELNASRDLRTLDLELWGDRMRPVIWQIKGRDDAMCAVIEQQSLALGLPHPEIPPFPEIPEFPKPRTS